MDGFFDIFSLLIAFYGLYFLFGWFRTVVQKQPVDTKNILPAEMTLKNCNDEKQFTSFILPWMLITGLSLVIYAALSYFFGNEGWFIIVVFVYFAAILTYYILTMRTARRRFWPEIEEEYIRKRQQKRKRKGVASPRQFLWAVLTGFAPSSQGMMGRWNPSSALVWWNSALTVRALPGATRIWGASPRSMTAPGRGIGW